MALLITGLSLLSSLPVVFGSLVLTFLWVRKKSKGKVLAYWLESNRFQESALVEAQEGGKKFKLNRLNGKKLSDEDGTSEEYDLESDIEVFTWWPEGPLIPQILKVPVPTYHYIRGNSTPIRFFDPTVGVVATTATGVAVRKAVTPGVVSAATRRQINDEKFLKGLLQVAASLVSGAPGVPKALRSFLMILAVLTASVLGITAAIGFGVYQLYNMIAAISASLGVS